MAPGTGPEAAAAAGAAANGNDSKKGGGPPPITGSLLAGLRKGSAGGPAVHAGSKAAAGPSNASVPGGLVPKQFEVGRPREVGLGRLMMMISSHP